MLKNLVFKARLIFTNWFTLFVTTILYVFKFRKTPEELSALYRKTAIGLHNKTLDKLIDYAQDNAEALKPQFEDFFSLAIKAMNKQDYDEVIKSVQTIPFIKEVNAEIDRSTTGSLSFVAFMSPSDTYDLVAILCRNNESFNQALMSLVGTWAVEYAEQNKKQSYSDLVKPKKKEDTTSDKNSDLDLDFVTKSYLSNIQNDGEA